MDDMKQKLYESLFFDIHSYTYKNDDECDELNTSHIAGCRIKKFYRVDNKYFDKYFNDTGNYISYIEGDIPSKVLVLEKVCALDRYRYTTHGKWLLHSEMMGTQLMNFLGCPCAYNIAIHNEEKSEDDYDIFSMNFIGKGDRFYTLRELNCNLSRGLEVSVSQLEKSLEDYFADFSDKDKERLLEDYVYSYLIRKYVIRDTDFFQGNSGIIVNKKKGTLKYINFDLEYSFGDEKNGLEKDLRFCYSRFPIIYTKFIQIVAMCRTGLNELKEEGIKYQSYIQEQNILTLACALRSISDVVEDITIDIALKTHY